MKLEQIGREIRKARIGQNLTQAKLAAISGITRTTLNQIENGTVKDIGIRKVEAILKQIGLELELRDVSALRMPPDFLRIASTSASVSFKDELTERELLRALMTGKIPPGRRPHLRMLLEEAPQETLEGLMRQLNKWSPPGRVEKNLEKIVSTLKIDPGVGRRWRTT